MLVMEEIVTNGITEKDYTLKISEYIHNRLDEMVCLIK